MKDFKAFDPLKAKTIADTDVAALAQKRAIKNILSSYVGWYDPFCELIQNSLDSLELRAEKDKKGYEPTIWITVDIQANALLVTDNGVGLNEDEFRQFLCPDISFKSGNTRGHKGVGATYLAYGFNYIQVATKSGDFVAVGKMVNARSWLDDENPSGNPKVKPDENKVEDKNFDIVDSGVSVCLNFDKSTYPGKLSWLVASKADDWFKILSVKTGLGAFFQNDEIHINIAVVDKSGSKTEHSQVGIGYYLPHEAVPKTASVKEIVDKEAQLFKKKGANFDLPSKYKNLDAIYQRWDHHDLLELEKNGQIKFTNDEKATIDKHSPNVYIVFVYSLKIWEAINTSLNVRDSVSILYGGIQIAANNMPQGETIQIPLKRNTGLQNQIHIIIHFNECSPDLGRKGFQSEIVDFSKELSRKITGGPLMKVKRYLRVNTGSIPNLRRETNVEEWKNEMTEHEKSSPLEIINESFFLPFKEIPITSLPTREQDVIALFNQLLAGGVIRGLRVMSTNERLTYDGLVRVVVNPPAEHHVYDEDKNPLGVVKSVIDEFDLPFSSAPRILEYKYSLDGLIEDIENGTKNSNDISMVVCWATGDEYKHNISYNFAA